MRLPLGTILLLAGATILPLEAQVPQGPNPQGQYIQAPQGFHQGGVMERLADQLNLTPSQRHQVRAIILNHRTTTQSLHIAARNARLAFAAAMSDPATTQDQLQALHQDLEGKQFQQALNLKAIRNEVRAILTPDQQVRFDQMHPVLDAMRQGVQGPAQKGELDWSF